MTAVIALRRLRWNDADGGEAVVEIRLGKPTYLSEQAVAECYCPYQIRRREVSTDEEEAGKGRRHEWTLLVEHVAYGVDTVQALYLALATVGVELSTLSGSPHPDDDHQPDFGFPAIAGPQ